MLKTGVSHSRRIVGRRCCQKHQPCHLLGTTRGAYEFSTDAAPSPLYLWLPAAASEAGSSNKILLPPEIIRPDVPNVSTESDILEQVNAHYSTSHFVGGMGEEDPGVWIGTTTTDTGGDVLEQAELLGAALEQCKMERHGVPFHILTSGTVLAPSIPLSELGLSTVQVSLFAASPPDYAKATGQDASLFQQVCGFIAVAAEEGIAVEAAVLSDHAGPARDLALSLGAQQVHVYPSAEGMIP